MDIILEQALSAPDFEHQTHKVVSVDVEIGELKVVWQSKADDSLIESVYGDAEKDSVWSLVMRQHNATVE